MKTIKTYSELIKLQTLEERFEYLKIGGSVGRETFGFDRYLNQKFYKSKEWQPIRDFVITRDFGCDLGLLNYPIKGIIIVHHMNAIDAFDLMDFNPDIMDPEFLISTSLHTHNAIHFGDDSLLPQLPVERFQNDTCPWR